MDTIKIRFVKSTADLDNTYLVIAVVIKIFSTTDYLFPFVFINCRLFL